MTAQKQDTGARKTVPVVSIHDRGEVGSSNDAAKVQQHAICTRCRRPHGVHR